jgi:TorA maturation chaperone TorD
MEMTMETIDHAQDALQLEALLLSRAYLYELFHKLLGGTLDESLVQALTADVTADALEEFADASGELTALGGFLSVLRVDDPSELLARARDEYTRIFVGPLALPASPYESPYTGAHDMATFQANTLEVRALYRANGLRVRREQAVPDDHVALMCALMADLSKRSLAALRKGDLANLAILLRDQRSFAEEHMANWLGIYAKSVRNSKAGAEAVLYPQMIEGLDALVRADLDFLAESAYWAEGMASSGAEQRAAGPAPELSAAQAALESLESLRPFGIQDNELVSVA